MQKRLFFYAYLLSLNVIPNKKQVIANPLERGGGGNQVINLLK